MKTLRLSATPAVAALLIASAGLGPAQTESYPDPPVVSATNPVRTRMSAVITPVGTDGRTRGRVTITPGGDGVTAIGRIAGLEPNKRYQIMVQPPAAPKASQKAGMPGGNVPAAGVTGSEPPPAGQDLGMMVADADGNAIVDSILPRVDRAVFPEGFTHCNIVINRAPPLDSPEERPVIAAGRIVATPGAPAPPPPPR